MRMALLSPRSVLPLMMFAGVLAIGLRIGDVWQTIHSGTLFAPVAIARAEEHASAEKPADPAPETKKEEKTEETPSTRHAPPKDPSARESALYQQLSGRREELEARGKGLDTREALIGIAEKRVDQKLQEMEALRTQLQSLLGQANAAQQAQIDNLVKIYEIMKPKEAAKILEAIDMPILLGVVKKMKPARTAAILAEMNPQKAKDITTELTRQNQLPQSP